MFSPLTPLLFTDRIPLISIFIIFGIINTFGILATFVKPLSLLCSSDLLYLPVSLPRFVIFGIFFLVPTGQGGVFVLPYVGYKGICGPKGYGFSVILVINRVSIFSHIASMYLFSTLALKCFFFRISCFFIKPLS